MLQGKQVRLRALEATDLERLYEWMNDRDVTRFLMARYPLSRSDEEKWLAETVGKNGFAHDVRLAIETENGTHIGVVGLHAIGPEDRAAELGIMIGDKAFWSNGYGTDAMLTILRFAFEQMNLHRVSLGVIEYNERGYACYRKCGFVEEGRSRDATYRDGRYWDIIRMGILRSEFEALLGESAEATVTTTAGG